MKPDWSKAPTWANYAAQELSGTYYFHETQPRYQELTGEWVSKGQREIVPRVTVTPQQTLESRPRVIDLSQEFEKAWVEALDRQFLNGNGSGPGPQGILNAQQD